MQIAGLVDLPVADGRISLSRRNRVDDDVKIVVPFWIETKVTRALGAIRAPKFPREKLSISFAVAPSPCADLGSITAAMAAKPDLISSPSPRIRTAWR